MAQSQAQYLAKLAKFVPGWYFTDKTLMEGFAVGVFNATAAMFAQIAADADSQQASTFILDSAGPVDDLHGDERSLPRLTSESDAAYNARIQNCLFLPVGLGQLESVVNPQLNNGAALFIENSQYAFYDDPDLSETPGFPYYDDYYTRWLDSHKTYNWWTLIIPTQSAGTLTTIFANVIAAIEANLGFGTTYDVGYNASGAPPGTTDDLLTESGQVLNTESGSGLSLEDGA